jgi:hypothetical protein
MAGFIDDGEIGFWAGAGAAARIQQQTVNNLIRHRLVSGTMRPDPWAGKNGIQEQVA